MIGDMRTWKHVWMDGAVRYCDRTPDEMFRATTAASQYLMRRNAQRKIRAENERNPWWGDFMLGVICGAALTMYVLANY